MVLPIASEAELVCAINFAPEMLAAARAAEATDPPRALCRHPNSAPTTARDHNGPHTGRTMGENDAG
jgi:hypothetical protein